MQAPHALTHPNGSRCDTVPGGGRLEHPFEVIDFLSEEPSDHGISCVGSRGLCGLLDAEMLASTNPAGESLVDAIRRLGGDPDALHRPLAARDSTAAFVELHIEQGPVLETHGIAIGVVTNIVGIRRFDIVVEGQPHHAGTTPMGIRRDALVGAAHLIKAVNRHARNLAEGPDDVVATIGHLTLTPNASNAVRSLNCPFLGPDQALSLPPAATQCP